MAKFKQFKLELQLEAQMPMIHFQSGQTGATIRATEVKPKLDAFLLRKISKEAGLSVSELKGNEQYKSLFIDADSKINDALDYKLQITVEEPSYEIDLGKIKKENGRTNREECYSIFYGNMGKKNPEEMIYGIFSNPKVTVICFKEKLRHYIENNIEKFFLVTNFGTMQNKGFGSFVPIDWCPKQGTVELNNEKMKEVANAYKELIPGGKCYAMKFERMPVQAGNRDAFLKAKNIFCVKISEAIKSFYSVMKSGQNLGESGYARSYIYEYGHSVLHMGNEKAWMKKRGIAPIVCKPQNQKKGEQAIAEENKYLRAFLGIGEQVEYGTGYRTNQQGKEVFDKKPAVKISISSKSKKIERLSSPIYFKVIRNVVFIVAFDIPEELYGAEFCFAGKQTGKRDGKDVIPGGANAGTIQVPSKDELKQTGGKFDIQDFLEKYVRYYNGELRNRIGRFKKAPRVEEVK